MHDDLDAITLNGMSFHTLIGVLPHEREHPQPFVFDLRLECAGGAAAASDRIEDAVDYSAVCDRVAGVAKARSYHLLERLADAVAAAVLDGFAVRRVRVRVGKPHAPLAHVVETVAVTVERERDPR
jgi:dihydroneopterin aldolase